MPDRDPKIDEGVRRPSDKWAAARAAKAARVPTGKTKSIKGGRTRYVGGGPPPPPAPTPAEPTPLDKLLDERQAKRVSEVRNLLWSEIKQLDPAKLKNQAWQAKRVVDKLAPQLVDYVDAGISSKEMHQIAETITAAVQHAHACKTSRATLERKQEKAAEEYEAARIELRDTTNRLKALVEEKRAQESLDALAVSKWETMHQKLQTLVGANLWLMDLMKMPQAEQGRPVTFEVTDAYHEELTRQLASGLDEQEARDAALAKTKVSTAGSIKRVLGKRPAPKPFAPVGVTEPSTPGAPEGLRGFPEPLAPATAKEAAAAGWPTAAPLTDPGAGSGFQTTEG